jgi:hypothetical protein
MIQNVALFLAIVIPSFALPAGAWSAGDDLASAERYDRAIMIVLPEASERVVPLATKPEDCGNTEWLTRDGRSMALAIGKALRDAGFGEAAVYSSQSCAAIETSNLLKLPNKGMLPFLNDIAETSVGRSRQREAMGWFLADQLGKPTMVFITHHNNVIDISGQYPGFGDAIVVTVDVTKFEPVFLRQIQVK